MTLLVKVCGLREQHHVDDAVDAGAEALGFVFAASPRHFSRPTIGRFTLQLSALLLRWQALRTLASLWQIAA